jgi:hypothetical protein
MLNKILSFISAICLITEACLGSIIDINKIKHSIKNTLVNFIVILIIGGAILLSIWLLALALGFFYLVSLQFTQIQAITILLGINIVMLLGLFIWLKTTTRQVKSIQ